MDVRKLFKAAKLVAATEPNLSREITKIAQELSETVTNTENFAPAGQADPMTNPNIKNFANAPATEDEKVTHRITLTLSAPKSLGELEVMNEVLPVINQIKGQKGIELKGYQFSQS